jgi:transposase
VAGPLPGRRLDGLVDLPRSGAPRQVEDAEIERVITLTLESQPANATHWSTRAMARRAGMSQTMVSRVWRAFGLPPHRAETFKLPTDPAFVDKVRDVVGLYLAPPHRAVGLCIDEKPQVQATTRTAPVLPLRPGLPERRTHDDRRAGMTDLFAALDVQAGRVIGRCTRRHRSVEFRAFLDQVEANVPTDLDVHLVLDNAAPHKTKLIHDWLLKRPRRHLHFTPTSASWLDLVEGWFALLARRQLQRGVFETTADLGRAIHAYIDRTNTEPKPFVWTKSADGILASVRRFCRQTYNSDH